MMCLATRARNAELPGVLWGSQRITGTQLKNLRWLAAFA